ncbi:FxDxF family PEP-CTERM protein [Rhodoferax sp.]|uniref:FxDxF family PEP-CTERM protein n=1 Tax=Rhodoferax sp. TaxID=50421 RepID=UPI0027211A2C|nr:FxDxF family PEP-CTERM protein [Rhodoferax sp.]MDO9197007.1 FxDxF family PEP-CTERM protein [Rhodoferax sp.]
MKLKLIALAAVLAAAGSANAAPLSTGSDGNGGLFFNIWDAAGSYSRNIGYTIDSFEAGLAAAGAFNLNLAADATLTTFMSTVDTATLQWNVSANDNAGARRLLETFATLPATTLKADSVRSMTGGTLNFVNNLNSKLVSSDSATYIPADAGYAGNPGNNVSGVLNFSNAGSFATNSAANGLSFMRINAAATGLAFSTYTPYVDGTDAVKVYLDGSNALHIAAVTAVPEPETYAMLLAGLGLMGAIARRRNKKSA